MDSKPIAFLGVFLLSAVALAQEKGLVAHYTFDEGQGNVAHDTSGHDNHGAIKGGAQFVTQGDGYALKLDGKDDFVDCGADPSLAIENAGTISFWFRPEACCGGLVAWTPTGNWPDCRFAAAFMTYRSSGEHAENGPLLMVTANGALHSFHASDQPEADTWQHYAIVFGDNAFVLYKNGRRRSLSPLGARPNLKGVPLWIGKCLGQGRLYFKGLMDEVRVYNRALAPHEVRDHYLLRAGAMGHDTSLGERLLVRAQPIPERGWILAEADGSLMTRVGLLSYRPLLQLTLGRPGATRALVTSDTVLLHPEMTRMTVALDARQVPPGAYEVCAVLVEPSLDRRPIGRTSSVSVQWPGQPEAFKHVKVLNNLVWELLDGTPGKLRGRKAYEFVNPTDRWVHISITAEAAEGDVLRVSLDDRPGTKDIIEFRGKPTRSRENMRFLAAGQHTIALEGRKEYHVRKLRVRSVAELIFQYGHNSHVTPFPKYIPDFAARHILPHVNTLVVRRYWLEQPFAREWTARGGRILYACPAPRPPKGEPRTVENAADFIAKTLGYTHPLAVGIIADEYGGSSARCAIDAKAVRRLHGTEPFKGRRFYPYARNLYNGPDGREFMQAVMDAGGANAWKQYLPEADNESLARDFITSVMVEPAYEFRRLCPGSIPHLIPCIGYFSAPPEFCDVNPGVNYKNFLDMQFHTIATHPVFFGVRGFMTYGVSYTDEEIARWGAKLFRHYGVEGRTERATSDPYALDHLTNPDFAQETLGWTLNPADKDSIRAVRKLGFGWHQGRFPRTDQGDTALLMVRSAAKPNNVSQEIRNLQPGRLYSLRMYTGDYKDMSKKEKHAVTISLDDVDLMPGKCFTHVFRNYPGHNIPGPKSRQAHWMNYHWRVFRARGKSASVTVTDWGSRTKPGGPIRQQLMFNFLQVQPYCEE